MGTHPIIDIVKLQKKGVPIGIFSVCSANPYVIEAALRRGLDFNASVWIEATANQVNQDGGYTGMTPIDFKAFVYKIAQDVDFPQDKIFLGGDHLGPLTWKHMPADQAMTYAKVLVRDYVLAGFSKIHLDTSMALGGEEILTVETMAQRSAELARVCQEAYIELKIKDKKALMPVFIVGSEVPIPGGSIQDHGVHITPTSAFRETVDIFKKTYMAYNLKEMWQQVVGVVVQPGVEFSDTEIIAYDKEKAKELTEALKAYPHLIFEGHSTDYQTPMQLKEMVKDGIGILKVGPGLTFALRESLFALESIEKEMSLQPLSNFKEILENTMVKHPENWCHHYQGNPSALSLKRKFSFSDRARYYMPRDEVETSIFRLIKNLSSTEIPLTLLSQYMPIQYQKVRKHQLDNQVKALLMDGVMSALDVYYYAVTPDHFDAHVRGW